MNFWIRVSPKGCVVGSTVEDEAETEEQAHAHFTPDPGDRVRELARGWRMRLVDAVTWDEIAEPCLRGICEHRTGRKPMKEKRVFPGPRCRTCGHLLTSHANEETCGQSWDVCNEPDCVEPRMLRWSRREQLGVLLSRMERGVLRPEERRLLRAAVEAEMDDTDRAWAEVAKSRRAH